CAYPGELTGEVAHGKRGRREHGAAWSVSRIPNRAVLDPVDAGFARGPGKRLASRVVVRTHAFRLPGTPGRDRAIRDSPLHLRGVETVLRKDGLFAERLAVLPEAPSPVRDFRASGAQLVRAVPHPGVVTRPKP